mgnify:CR=1 FL=1
MEKKINYQFKILYFFGIFFIVACHCGYGGISLGYEWFYPGAFHLALFAFGSGYFYKTSSEEHMGSFIIKKVKHLLVPMYLWNFVYAIILMILRNNKFTFGGKISLYNLLISPMINGHVFALNFPTWFVFPLFVVQVATVLMRKPLSKYEKINDWVVLVISLIIGIAAAFAGRCGWNRNWKLLFVRAGYLFPFYQLAIVYKNKWEKHDTLNNIAYFGILFLAQLLIIYKYGGTIYYTLSWAIGFENGIIATPTIVAILGIAFWLRVSRILAPILQKNKLVMMIADNTDAVMTHHIFAFFIINTIYAAINKLTGTVFCSSFDWEQYRSNVQYAFCPENLGQFRIVYMVAGLILPLIIVILQKKVKEKINGRFKKITT